MQGLLTRVCTQIRLEAVLTRFRVIVALGGEVGRSEFGRFGRSLFRYSVWFVCPRGVTNVSCDMRIDGRHSGSKFSHCEVGLYVPENAGRTRDIRAILEGHFRKDLSFFNASCLVSAANFNFNSAASLRSARRSWRSRSASALAAASLVAMRASARRLL